MDLWSAPGFVGQLELLESNYKYVLCPCCSSTTAGCNEASACQIVDSGIWAGTTAVIGYYTPLPTATVWSSDTTQLTLTDAPNATDICNSVRRTHTANFICHQVDTPAPDPVRLTAVRESPECNYIFTVDYYNRTCTSLPSQPPCGAFDIDLWNASTRLRDRELNLWGSNPLAAPYAINAVHVTCAVLSVDSGWNFSPSWCFVSWDGTGIASDCFRTASLTAYKASSFSFITEPSWSKQGRTLTLA